MPENPDATPLNPAEIEARRLAGTIEVKDLRLAGFVEDRSTVCIATFVDGFSIGWRFAVPDAFRDALDIKWTERVVNKTRIEHWTQGRLYTFNEGDVIYDTVKAYKDWKLALEDIGFCVQVKRAVPSSVVVKKTFNFVGAVQVREDGSEAPNADELDNPIYHDVSYTRTRLNYGFIEFALMVPDSTKSKLVERDRYQTNQEWFVGFLQTGILVCNDGSQLELQSLVKGLE